jgi:hypothetical protein
VCARAVSDEGWSSQLAAATALGISLYRVGYVIATGNLEAVGEPSECGGVTRGSLDSEIAWCRVETPSRGAGWEAPSHPLPMAVNRRSDDARDDFPLSDRNYQVIERQHGRGARFVAGRFAQRRAVMGGVTPVTARAEPPQNGDCRAGRDVGRTTRGRAVAGGSAPSGPLEECPLTPGHRRTRLKNAGYSQSDRGKQRP